MAEDNSMQGGGVKSAEGQVPQSGLTPKAPEALQQAPHGAEATKPGQVPQDGSQSQEQRHEAAQTDSAAAAAGGESAAEQAAATKPLQEKALDQAADAEGGTDVAGEKQEGLGVFMDGRQVIEVLPKEKQTPQKEFVRCLMSDRTTVDVPRGLFDGKEELLSDLDEKDEDKSGDEDTSEVRTPQA